MKIEEQEIKNILTRTSGYLLEVSTHTLQPYRGCAFGNSLCGAGCYVRHNPFVTRGRLWGTFLEARVNAARSYSANAKKERAWAHGRGLPFSVFLSSSTEPFPPQEMRLGLTQGVLQAMLSDPPDLLIVQTHSHLVANYQEILHRLASRTSVRIHISIESDRDRLPGLPPPASSVARRMLAARTLRESGLFTVITVSPLLPIERPEIFFQQCGEASNALVLDHFVGGDGSAQGRRTRQTALPVAMEACHPGSSSQEYLHEVVTLARLHYPGPIGLSREGFAGRYTLRD